MSNPKDRLLQLIKLAENELSQQYRNHGFLDSTPILEMVRDELYDIECNLEDDWSVSGIIRRLKRFFRNRQTETLINSSKPSNARQALSKVLLAIREEENSRATYLQSQLWQNLNEARDLLSKDLNK